MWHFQPQTSAWLLITHECHAVCAPGCETVNIHSDRTSARGTFMCLPLKSGLKVCLKYLINQEIRIVPLCHRTFIIWLGQMIKCLYLLQVFIEENKERAPRFSMRRKICYIINLLLCSIPMLALDLHFFRYRYISYKVISAPNKAMSSWSLPQTGHIPDQS